MDTPPSDAPGFTVDWFSHRIPAWTWLFANNMPNPRQILEIGAFEGRATCFMLEHLLPAEGGEIHCVDTWEGGAEHNGIAMDAVARRFRANVGAVLARRPMHQVVSHRGRSRHALGNLIAQGNAGKFDFLYVDGSHQAADVLEDLVLGFRLCRPGAIVICDDYLWQRQPAGQEDVLDTPKIAIDAFTTIYRRRLRLLEWPSSYQVAFRKTAD